MNDDGRMVFNRYFFDVLFEYFICYDGGMEVFLDEGCGMVFSSGRVEY